MDGGPLSPFLHLTNELLGDVTFNTNAAQTLRRWSRADRQTLLNLHLHIAVAKGIAVVDDQPLRATIVRDTHLLEHYTWKECCPTREHSLAHSGELGE